MSRPTQPVPPALLTVARRQAGLVSLRQCLQHEMTARQATCRVERKEWERVARGVFDTGTVVPATWSEGFDHRRRRNAVLGPLAHPGGVAVGMSALVLHGVQGTPFDALPEVAMPKARPRNGRSPVRVRRILVPEPVDIDGIACQDLRDALALAVPALGRRDAVAVIDSACWQGLLPESDMARARAGGTGRRGARWSWALWDLVDRRSESPAESWARLSCQDTGFSADAVQLWVVSRGRWSRLDLAWVLPDGGLLIVEIDGRDVHSRMEALVDDRARQNRLDGRHTIIRRFTGREAWDGTVAAEVGRVLSAAGWSSCPVPDGLAYDIERAEFVPIDSV